jgi:hypothetical protein
MSDKTKTAECKVCNRGFSIRGIAIHTTRMHSPVVIIPQPVVVLPEKTIARAVNPAFLDHLNLIGGGHLDVGDVFWHVRKFVIKEITKTAGSNTVSVMAECTKKNWQENQPI